MRAVVQRVSAAEVRVEGARVARSGPGLLALVGVARGDGPDDADKLAEKVVHLRVFGDDEGKMNRSLLDTGGTLTLVSQFTLMGDCRKGRRPSYGHAEEPALAAPLIARMAEAARALGAKVETGEFRAHMAVTLTNDGPVTLLLDTAAVF